MEQIPTARDIMRPRPCHAMAPDMDIYDAMRILVEKRRATAPVLDEDGRLVGILTEKDCLRVVSTDAYNKWFMPVLQGTVSKYMSPMDAALKPRMGLFALVDAFLNTGFICLPVLEEGRIVGCISRHLMLSVLLKMERRLETNRAKDRVFQTMIDRGTDAIGDIMKAIATLKKGQVAVLFRHRLGAKAGRPPGTSSDDDA